MATLPDTPSKNYDEPYTNPRVNRRAKRQERSVVPLSDSDTLGQSKTLAELAERPPAYRLAEIDLSKIFFDNFCRQPVESNLNRLRKDWRLQAVGTIYVSARPNDAYSLLEGGHRVLVAIENNVKTLPARVYLDLTYEQEAALYNLFNTYSPHSALDRLKGRLEAKVPKVIDMTHIIQQFDLEWDFNRKHSAGHIKAAATIETAYDTWGPQVLHDAIALLHEAWGTDNRAYQDDSIAGAVQFLARYGGYKFSVIDSASDKPIKFDRSRMLSLMRERGIRQFRSEALQISLAEHLRRSHSFGRAMRSIYNLHLQTRTLPTWPERLYSETGSAGFKERAARGWETTRRKREALAAASS